MRGRLFQVCCSKVVAYSKRAIIRRVSGLLFIILEKNREKAQNFRHSLYLYEEVFKQGFITVINLCVVSRGVFLLPSPPLFTPILDIVPHFSQSALHLHFRFIIKSPAAVRFPPKLASLKSGGKGVRRQHRTLNSRTLKAKQTIRIHNFHVVLECCRF